MTFVKGQSITESFLSSNELLHFYKKNKIPAILWKVDFAKAFDTVDWCFLVNLLIEREFPPKWLAVVLSILSSSKSMIMVNGNQTPFFSHQRGLHQGDSLSPLIFILLTDSLQAFIVNCVLLFHEPIILHPQILQFADDTIIFSKARPETLKMLSLILHNYEILLLTEKKVLSYLSQYNKT